MPTKERVADMTVTTTQLAAVLGITNRRVQQLTQDGVLTTVSRGKFVLGDVVQAYNASTARGGLTKEEAAEAKKLDHIKQKAEATLKASKAKIAQAEAKELSGQMHRSEDVAAMTSELIYTVRGALMALPSRVAINAAALSDPAGGAGGTGPGRGGRVYAWRGESDSRGNRHVPLRPGKV